MGSSAQADWLSIGCPKLEGRRKTANLNLARGQTLMRHSVGIRQTDAHTRNSALGMNTNGHACLGATSYQRNRATFIMKHRL